MKIDGIDDGAYTLPGPTSMNNRLIVEQYVNQGQLKATIQHGIAMVSQKVSLKGLKVLVDARLSDGVLVLAGSIAFIKEEKLHAQQWAKQIMECDVFTSKFIIVNLVDVEFIVPPEAK